MALELPPPRSCGWALFDPTSRPDGQRLHTQLKLAGRRMAAPILAPHGTWRSLAAHQSGGLGVAGSNPAVPTTRNPCYGGGFDVSTISDRCTPPKSGRGRGEGRVFQRARRGPETCRRARGPRRRPAGASHAVRCHTPRSILLERESAQFAQSLLIVRTLNKVRVAAFHHDAETEEGEV